MISLKINLKSIVLIVSIAFLILVQIVFVSHNSQQPDIFGKYSSQLFSIICINFGFIVLLATAIFNERIAKKLFSYMKNITLSFSTIIVVFIIAEIFVSILNPLGINYFSELKKYFSDMIEDDLILYRHKPGITRKYQQECVSINSFGLRDSEIDKDKETTIRLLLLGDSEVDMRTAHAAGMMPIGALWGFRSEQELLDSGARALIGRPLELMRWLEDR